MTGQPKPLGWLFSGIDYRSFKLFTLSLLWRAAVSKRDEFRNVRIAKRHRDQLRTMLWNDDPGEPLDFACLLTANPTHLQVFGDLVIMPDMVGAGQERLCRFIIGGMFWVFWVPKAPAEAERYRVVASKQGELMVARNDHHAGEFFRQFAMDLKRRGKLPPTPKS